MIQFQESMLQMTNSFLQTQQHVMLAYLKTRSTSTEAMPFFELPPTATTLVVPTNLIRPMADPITRPANPQPTIDVLDDEPPEQIQTGESIPVKRSTPGDSIESHSETAPEQMILLDSDGLVSAFIELVSQRTGYPVDMLDPDLDLESDLGIDSIKRVEILSNFRRLLSEEMQQQFEGSLEELAGLRTLQGISDWIRQIPQQI
jgi:acyl carrier protein